MARRSQPVQGRRQALNVKSRHDRVSQRKVIGSLKDSLIKPLTLRLYTQACAVFFDLIVSLNWILPSEMWDFDLLMCECIELWWSEGEPRALVGNVLSGVEHFCPPVRGNLRGSWRLWRAWGANELPCRAPPFSLPACLAICFYMWEWGYSSAATLTLLAFHRFLRTAEFVSLTKRQLNFHPEHKPTKVFIQFDNSKTAKRNHNVEGVTIEDVHLVRHLHKLFLAAVSPLECLMPFSMAQYRKIFAAACSAAGLGSEFKPYSLRRGGATHHFRECHDMTQTMEIGRWREARTARIYVNTALLELTAMREMSSKEIANAAAHFEDTFVHS